MQARPGRVDLGAIVVGGGVVGLAIGRALAIRGVSVAVLEGGEAVGRGISSRSSEVIHAGLYYPRDSLRARLCLQGREQLYDYAQARAIPHRRCGKLVVACERAEVPRLQALMHQAQANGVHGLRWLDASGVRQLEPALRAEAALYSAASGIIDSFAFQLCLQGEIEDAGGAVVLRTPFTAARLRSGGGFDVSANGEVLCTRLLVIAAGLGAQSAAARVEGYPASTIPQLHLGKGSYFALRGRAPFQRLVYPLPVEGALGVHYTLDLHGQARFGPDLEFVSAEDYRVDPGRVGFFQAQVRRYWPGLAEGALVPAHAAIRPKLHGPGEAQPDFRIDGIERHGLPGLVALFGIESPGLTCALALGEHVAAVLAG